MADHCLHGWCERCVTPHLPLWLRLLRHGYALRITAMPRRCGPACHHAYHDLYVLDVKTIHCVGPYTHATYYHYPHYGCTDAFTHTAPCPGPTVPTPRMSLPTRVTDRTLLRCAVPRSTHTRLDTLVTIPRSHMPLVERHHAHHGYHTRCYLRLRTDFTYCLVRT